MNDKVLSRLPVLLLISTLMLAQHAVAAPKNNQQLTDDIEATQKNLSAIQDDMQKLHRLLDNRALLELFQRMDDLGDEVSNLRGMLEQQNHELSGLKKRQRELYLDIDRRLRELEITTSRVPGAVVPEIPDPVKSTPEPSPAPEPEVAQAPAPEPATVTTQTEVNVPVAVPAPTPVLAPAPVSKPAAVSTTPQPPVSQEREEYQKAFDMLKEGRYAMATASFKEFIQNYSRSSYAGNAQYWLGEANYVTRKFEQAVIEFRKVLEIYPNSNKVPDAMLKLGYTYYELRSNNEAKQILNQLRQLYPKTTAARLAGKRLERMRKEGL